MRRDARQNITVNVENIQGYHEGGYGESYAYSGFGENLYFNSDRAERTHVENGVLVRESGKPLQAWCPEVEIECNSISRSRVLMEVLKKVVFPNFKFGDKMFKVQHDGSLGGESSGEIIPQPMTMGRIRNDYAAYKAMWEYFDALGIETDNYNTDCGMHINISNACFGKTEAEILDNVRKLYYFINEHYTFCRKLFYRSEYKTEWCRRMTAETWRNRIPWGCHATPEEFDYHNAKSLDISKLPNDHGLCLNYSHFKAGRIEIRLPGGQRDYYCFRNTMESAFFLVEKLRKTRWEELDDLVKFFRGCNQYVCKRLIDCVDTVFTREMYEDILRHSKQADFELHRR